MDKDAILAFDIMLAPFAIAFLPFILPIALLKARISGDNTDGFKMFAIATTLNELFGG